MDDRFINTSRYDALRPSSEASSEKLDVQHKKIDAKMAEYLRLLATHHPFARNTQADENRILSELRARWPKMPGWERQANRLLRMVNDIVCKSHRHCAEAKYFGADRSLSTRPMIANVLLEPLMSRPQSPAFNSCA